MMPTMNGLSNKRRKLLDGLQADAFKYFLHEVNPANGLVVDCTKENFPSSIAATGLALSAYPGWVKTWFEHMLDIERRRFVLMKKSPGEVSDRMKGATTP